MDPSSSYLACSCGNCIDIYNYENGELITQAAGHGDAVTGVIFLPDCRHLISVSSLALIFIYPKLVFQGRKINGTSYSHFLNAHICNHFDPVSMVPYFSLIVCSLLLLINELLGSGRCRRLYLCLETSLCLHLQNDAEH